MKLTTGDAFEIDDKRFYMPGTTLTDVCPKCGVECEHDFGEFYLSYPTANEPFDHTLTCEQKGCYHEWKVRLLLAVELREATAQ